MKHSRLALSCAAAFGAALAWSGLITNAWAQQVPPAITGPVQQAAPADTTADELPLGRAFERLSEGLSFQPPANCRLIGDMSSKYIAEWADDSREWTLKLGRMDLDRPTPLVSMNNNDGLPVEGVLNKTVKSLTTQLPNSTVLRQDVTNTRDRGVFLDKRMSDTRNNVGLIAIRYTNNGKRRLSQQAIIHSTDNVYYLLTLTSAGADAIGVVGAEDPNERVAVDVFTRMIDSIRLLDRRAIIDDQNNRLFNTRSTLLNFTVDKLRKVLVKEQWVRIMRDGKDVGYTYITEQTAGGIPRALRADELAAGKKEIDVAAEMKGDPGILVGVRGRMITEGIRTDKTKGPIQNDNANWFFVSADKKHEDFSRLVFMDDHKSSKRKYVQEFGVSEKRVRRMVEKAAADPKADAGPIKVDRNPDLHITYKEDWELDVSQTTNSGMADPIIRKLPPWYTPQVLTYMLPRLLPLDRPRGYLFAEYVSDAQEVVMRYVDVGTEETVNFGGQMIRAIPIRDHLGLEGSVTVHYVRAIGQGTDQVTQYLGSENKEQKLVMLPTTEDTLKHVWADANLSRPGGIDRPATPLTGGEPTTPRTSADR